MKILQFNLYQCENGEGHVESKKSKPISAPPHGAGLKSSSIPAPAPSPLWGGENSHEVKRRGASQAEQGKIVIPTFEVVVNGRNKYINHSVVKLVNSID